MQIQAYLGLGPAAVPVLVGDVASPASAVGAPAPIGHHGVVAGIYGGAPVDAADIVVAQFACFGGEGAPGQAGIAIGDVQPTVGAYFQLPTVYLILVAVGAMHPALGIGVGIACVDLGQIDLKSVGRAVGLHGGAVVDSVGLQRILTVDGGQGMGWLRARSPVTKALAQEPLNHRAVSK